MKLLRDSILLKENNNNYKSKGLRKLKDNIQDSSMVIYFKLFNDNYR
jgi:hypothetical protein